MRRGAWVPGYLAHALEGAADRVSELPADPFSGVVGGMREDEVVFNELTAMGLDDLVDRIGELPADTLRGLLFTLVIRERFRRGLDEKRERIAQEAFRASLRGRVGT